MQMIVLWRTGTIWLNVIPDSIMSHTDLGKKGIQVLWRSIAWYKADQQWN